MAAAAAPAAMVVSSRCGKGGAMTACDLGRQRKEQLPRLATLWRLNCGRGATSSSRSEPSSRPPSCHCLALTTPLPPSRHRALALPFPTSCCLAVELPYRPCCGAASILRPRSSLVVIALNEEDPWATLRNAVSSYCLSSLAEPPSPHLLWPWAKAGLMEHCRMAAWQGERAREGDRVMGPTVGEWYWVAKLCQGLERFGQLVREAVGALFFMELPSFSLEVHLESVGDALSCCLLAAGYSGFVQTN